jgi:hypothetical protein
MQSTGSEYLWSDPTAIFRDSSQRLEETGMAARLYAECLSRLRACN